VLKQRRNPPEEIEMKLHLDRIDHDSSPGVLKQRINGSKKKADRANLLAEARNMNRGAKRNKMRELNAGELLGMRMRIVWNLIAEGEPGSGNCAVPLALLALARWDQVSDAWLTFLAQVYGAEILSTVEEWVQSGSVEKITDDDGRWYRLAIFPRGYEKLLTLVANEEPGMYMRAMDRTQGRMGRKGSMEEVAKQAATNWQLEPGFPNRLSKEDLARLKKALSRQ
jgi:hypothetical protein